MSSVRGFLSLALLLATGAYGALYADPAKLPRTTYDFIIVGGAYTAIRTIQHHLIRMHSGTLFCNVPRNPIRHRKVYMCRRNLLPSLGWREDLVSANARFRLRVMLGVFNRAAVNWF